MKSRDFQLLTPKEMSERLSISPRHLQKLKEQRLIPHIKMGKSVRYNAENVFKALDKLTIREHD